MQPLVAAVVTAIVVLLLVSPLLAVVAFVRMRIWRASSATCRPT